MVENPTAYVLLREFLNKKLENLRTTPVILIVTCNLQDKIHRSGSGNASKCKRGAEKTNACRNGEPSDFTAANILQQ